MLTDANISGQPQHNSIHVEAAGGTFEATFTQQQCVIAIGATPTIDSIFKQPSKQLYRWYKGYIISVRFVCTRE